MHQKFAITEEIVESDNVGMYKVFVQKEIPIFISFEVKINIFQDPPSLTGVYI